MCQKRDELAWSDFWQTLVSGFMIVLADGSLGSWSYVSVLPPVPVWAETDPSVWAREARMRNAKYNGLVDLLFWCWLGFLQSALQFVRDHNNLTTCSNNDTTYNYIYTYVTKPILVLTEFLRYLGILKICWRPFRKKNVSDKIHVFCSAQQVLGYILRSVVYRTIEYVTQWSPTTAIYLINRTACIKKAGFFFLQKHILVI